MDHPLRPATRSGLALMLAALLGCDPTPFPVGGPGEGDDDAADDDAAGDDDTAADPCEPDPTEGTVTVSEECLQYNPYEEFDPDEVVEWTWSSSALAPESTDVMMAPIVISLTDDNGDGAVDDGDVPDVVFITFVGPNYHDTGVLRAISGDDGHDLWAVTDPALGTAPGGMVAAADLTGDGVPEIVAISDTGHPIAFDAAGTFLWESTLAVCRGYGYVAPAIADMDHDGSPEIVVGDGVLAFDGTVRGEGAYGCGYGFSFPADIDGDGVQEVVAGNAIYEIDGTASFHREISDGYPAVGDFDGDGDPEIVITGNGYVRLMDHELNDIWGPVPTAGTGGGGPPTVADYDGDGLPEVGVADLGQYAVYDGADGAILWTNPTEDDSSSQTGSSVFDFNGDGVAEVVYADEHVAYIYQGTDGSVLFEAEGHASGTLFEQPLVVDIDGDDSGEIVVASNDYAWAGWTGITVLGATEASWWPARRIWNQHAYHVTNIEDDGTVPQVEDPVWQDYNCFRQQVPQFGWGGFEAPDLFVEADVCTETCPEFSTLLLRVGDSGTAGVVAGLPLDISTDDGSGTLVYDQTVYLPDAVDAGAVSGQFAVEIDADTERVRIIVDHTAQGDELHVECDETNNHLLLDGPFCPP